MKIELTCSQIDTGHEADEPATFFVSSASLIPETKEEERLIAQHPARFVGVEKLLTLVKAEGDGTLRYVEQR